MAIKFEDLDLFVKNCYLDYEETGDFFNQWGEAWPKCKGGTETTTF